MSQPYIGEIRMFAGNFNPNGWDFCNGQVIPISENDSLFTLIGTTYGGDGQETFALPNLQGRIPIHMGTGPDGTTYQIGEAAGVESVTLTTQQIPTHNHTMLASQDTADGVAPTSQVLAASSDANVTIYGTDAPTTTLAPQSVQPQGGSQPHENMQPYLGINFIISLYGIFPSQT